MTEKRFTYDSKTVSILKDGDFWLDGNVDTACNHSEICHELNELHEENKLMENHLEILRLHRDILMGKNRELRNEILKYQENIKSAIQSERTELGSSVLRNLASNLRIEL